MNRDNAPMPDVALELSGVTYRYPGAATAALEGVSLRVGAGETLAVVGPNGAGKTTLLRLLLGLVDPSAGSVRVCGVSAAEARRRRLVGYVSQRTELERWIPLTGVEAVAMAASMGSRRIGGGRAARARAREQLDRVGAMGYADRPVGSLSGGELQRVLIARALAVDPRVLALDEPTVGIDAAGQARFGDLLSSLRKDKSLTIVLVSHDLRAVASGWAMCDRVACVRRTIHFHDAPGGVTPQVLAEVFEHDLSPVFGEMHVDAHRAADCDHDHAHGGGGS